MSSMIENPPSLFWTLDLSRFDAAPLIAFTVTKNTWNAPVDGPL